ncbi:NADP-dependent malic enzyme [Arenibaculum sp.]|uniref:NADP-dependent malic enzyme n=1 Tax=Arenibaculum sp. TaxID=2865862 RepID=UPI002E13964A|nr:NADP-dependent malic enzyme [Arenibaculum sp.]
MADNLKDAALDYHRYPSPGKIAVQPTKPLATQRDLALAYSPGVAAACDAIVADPQEASRVTARGNLVAVVTNGTAVLGLGAIGPLAAKPVMEGKGVLFKKFAGIDVFDIEIDETDPDRLVDVVAALEPTFGGINLEDIKAPECFYIEEKLRERMRIPVFHDDQHGTAIIVGAAVTNALRLTGKRIDEVRLVTSGAGAAALACLDLLVDLGMPVGNITVTDIAGVVYEGRNELMDPRKERYARRTEARTLAEVIGGADIFLGLSAPRVLKPEMVERMASRPVILALANPVPEIMPEEVRAVRPDAIMATGRSDYPNQVNNVLCFPFIFRGALDVGATAINEAMKIAAVKAIAGLALAEPSDIVATAYGEQQASFGPEYLIPKPFDPRLILEIAPAVAKAAMDSGVATRPIGNFPAYRDKLNEFVFRSGLVMRPVFARAKQDPRRIAYAEGEEERVLRAVQVVVDDGLARPILIGRREVVARRAERLGLRIRQGDHYDLVDPEDDPRYHDYWTLYHRLMERRGVSPDAARTILRTNTTVIGSLMVRRGEADAVVCGTIGRYTAHLDDVLDVLELKPGVRMPAALSALILPKGTYFLCDTYVSPDPGPDEIAEMTLQAAEEVRRFGIVPKVALVSHSSFGSHDDPDARKMRLALAEILRRAPDLEVEGEMHADAALSEEIRDRIFPNSRLRGAANLLIMPTLDAANIAFNLLKVLGEGLSIGPILLGCAKPAHILTPSVSVRGIVNVSALATVDAQMQAAESGG